jgi:hypothetical protein
MIRNILTIIIIVVLVLAGVIFAGDLTNTNTPAGNFYTIEDIYNKLSSGTTATEGDHPLSASAAIASSMYTLTDIWNLISADQQALDPASVVMPAGYYSSTTMDTVDTDLLPENIKIGVTILGVTGSYTPFAGGIGTVEDPFQIANCIQLQSVNDFLASNFILTADIDCSDTVNWNGGEGFRPIGDVYEQGANFTGTFDGRGHTIDSLYIHYSHLDRNGFFGTLSTATIENVGLTNVDVLGGLHTGALAGQIWASTIRNAYTTGVVAVVTGSAGGFVGLLEAGNTIDNSYTTVSVSGPDVIGGFTGENRSIINNSFATGEVTGPGGGFAGTTVGTFSNDWYSNGRTDEQQAGIASTTIDSFYNTGSAPGGAVYTAWDFDTVWQANEGALPTLRIQ